MGNEQSDPDAGGEARIEVPLGPISRHLTNGSLIPFLGAGASIVPVKDGPPLPLGRALARRLAIDFAYPSEEGSPEDLAMVASYCEKVNGTREDLKDSLHQIFDRRVEPGPLHRFLAGIEAPLLILTTNYDELIETAFDDAGRPYQLIVYPADERVNRGSVLWRESGSRELVFVKPESLAIDPKKAVIYKMHGTCDRSNARNDHFVISEEDYVRYLAQMPFPAVLQARMRGKRFLFLGYGLRDWNFRVMLHKLDPANASVAAPAAAAPGEWKSWAIMRHPSEVEKRIWSKKQVELCDADIDSVVAALQERLAAGASPF